MAATYFENGGNGIALYDAATGVRGNGGNIVSQENALQIRRPRQRRFIIGPRQPNVLRSYDIEIATHAE
jgi:hypothetical protein